MVDILFFSAHPDDAEFGTGGTLIKLAKKYSVANVILTHGEAGTYGTPDEREKEAACAGERGNYEVEFLDFIDNHIEDNVDSAKKIAEVIRKYQPKIIFTPYHTNYAHKSGAAHPDHSATGRIVRKAARFAKFKNADIPGDNHQTAKLIYYMLPKGIKPSFIVDVSDVVDEMQEVWKCFETQLQIAGGKVFDRLLLFRKAKGLENGIEYAESFFMEENLQLDVNDILKI
jgi:LmbE family N-acetylglucosaminyl deacetylase